jgi:hypothetical protein
LIDLNNSVSYYKLEIAVSVTTRASSAQVRIMREVITYAITVINSTDYVGPLDPDIGVIIPGEGIDDRFYIKL